MITSCESEQAARPATIMTILRFMQTQDQPNVSSVSCEACEGQPERSEGWSESPSSASHFC